jgi:chromosomal replication initiator protein
MKAWEQFLIHQAEELGAETVDKWLRPLQIVHFDACNLYLEAKDPFQLSWFEEHIRAKVLSSLLNNNKKRIKVHLSLVHLSSIKSPAKKSKKEKVTSSSTLPPFNLNFDTLDPDHTFDHLVMTESLILPHKLLSQISSLEAPFNPIYLHGQRGSSKTHLLMATANTLKKQGVKVLYTRAETFTEHVVSAIRAGEMRIFRQAYRNSDVLIIDDVHLFSHKGATQEELFHTFNTLHLSGKQIILSSHCAPAELQSIEPRLVSRFEWGIVLPLNPLSHEEIKQIVVKKMEAYHFLLHNRVIEFLLETFAYQIKPLIRALQALILRTHLDIQNGVISSTNLTPPQVKHFLNDLILEQEAASLTPQKIIQGVAEYFGIRSEDILGKAQTRECVLPRQIAMYFCRKELEWPFMKIGELFAKDHSTVMSSVKGIFKALEGDNSDVKMACQTISKKFVLP